MTKPNLSGLSNAEALALSQDPYYQPKSWDWAYMDGQPPVWTEPEQVKRLVKLRQKGDGARFPTLSMRLRRSTSRFFCRNGALGSIVAEEEDRYRGSQLAGGLAMDGEEAAGSGAFIEK